MISYPSVHSSDDGEEHVLESRWCYSQHNAAAGGGGSARDRHGAHAARRRVVSDIALLSGVNTLLQVFDAKIRFIFGLGITQVVDAVGKGVGQNGMVVTLAVDGLFLLMLILCWKWAKTGSQGAFIGGMIAYALDGVLLLIFSVWLDAAVHAYALYMMWQGFAAARELAQMQMAAQPGLSRPTLP